MIDGQMNIFEFIENPIKFHPVIDELSNDIHRMFDNLSEETYEVWDHVPALGKRYEVWLTVNNLDKIDSDIIDALIDKYKKKQIELSFNTSGCLHDSGYIVMVSTLWTTKGHRELVA